MKQTNEFIVLRENQRGYFYQNLEIKREFYLLMVPMLMS